MNKTKFEAPRWWRDWFSIRQECIPFIYLSPKYCSFFRIWANSWGCGKTFVFWGETSALVKPYDGWWTRVFDSTIVVIVISSPLLDKVSARFCHYFCRLSSCNSFLFTLSSLCRPPILYFIFLCSFFWPWPSGCISYVYYGHWWAAGFNYNWKSYRGV